MTGISFSKRLAKLEAQSPDNGLWFRAGPDGIIPDEFRPGIDRLVIRLIHGRPEPQLSWRGKPYGQGERCDQCSICDTDPTTAKCQWRQESLTYLVGYAGTK